MDKNPFKKTYNTVVGKNKKNTQMFNKKFWVIPLNTPGHWSLMIFVRPKFIFEETTNPDKETLIFFFDSLGKKYTTIINQNNMKILNDFLHYAYILENTSKTNIIINSIQLDKVKKTSIDCYKQDNSFDCGIFVCIYARAFLLSVIRDEVIYTEKDFAGTTTFFY